MLFHTTTSFLRGFGRPRSRDWNGGPGVGPGATVSFTAPFGAPTQRDLATSARDVHELLHLGLTVPQLRDEIYLHILKELSLPVADTSAGSAYVASGQRLDDQRSLVAGLGLLCMVTSVFLPSLRLLPFVAEFLRRFRHAILMQCAPFRRRATCLLFSAVLFGQLLTTPSQAEVRWVGLVWVGLGLSLIHI